MTRTNDELPEKFRIDPAGLPQSPWDQGPTSIPSGGSNTGGQRFAPAGVPGGEQISKAELAAASNNPLFDNVGVVKPGARNYAIPTTYNGAGQGEMPVTFPNLETTLPRKSSAGSWSTQGAGGGSEPHPTAVTEWKGGGEPKKPA